MKTHILALLLGPLGLLHADGILQNSDFTDGIAHWYGDCKTTADVASSSDAPLQISTSTSASAPAPGLVVQLRNGDWTKVSQDFETKPGAVRLSIIYTLSPDLKFSDHAGDYTNMTGAIGFSAWRAYPTQIGQWAVLMCDIAAGHATIAQIAPQSGTAQQTYTATFSRLKSDEKKTLCLAFPPGIGTITFQNISLTPVADTP